MLYLFYPLQFLAYLCAFSLFFYAWKCGEVCADMRQMCAIFRQLCEKVQEDMRGSSCTMRESAAKYARVCGIMCATVR